MSRYVIRCKDEKGLFYVKDLNTRFGYNTTENPNEAMVFDTKKPGDRITFRNIYEAFKKLEPTAIRLEGIIYETFVDILNNINLTEEERKNFEDVKSILEEHLYE